MIKILVEESLRWMMLQVKWVWAESAQVSPPLIAATRQQPIGYRTLDNIREHVDIYPDIHAHTPAQAHPQKRIIESLTF